MWTIFFAFLIVAIGMVLANYWANSKIAYQHGIFLEQLAEKDKTIKALNEDIQALCVLNTLPIVGNFEDDDAKDFENYFPSEERYNEMLENILFETGIIHQN